MPVVLWLLAEPLSLEGEANGAEMQLPVWRIIRRGKQITAEPSHHIWKVFSICSNCNGKAPGPFGVRGGVGLPGTGECWKLDIPPEHQQHDGHDGHDGHDACD